MGIGQQHSVVVDKVFGNKAIHRIPHFLIKILLRTPVGRKKIAVAVDKECVSACRNICQLSDCRRDLSVEGIGREIECRQRTEDIDPARESPSDIAMSEIKFFQPRQRLQTVGKRTRNRYTAQIERFECVQSTYPLREALETVAAEIECLEAGQV